MAEWLIPWEKRGHSGATDDNFLWRHGNLYVMDNHRLALWCWWQHLHESPFWGFTHVDRHYDALWQGTNPWPTHAKAEHRTDLESFRAATFRSSTDAMDFELYRWDTITSALWSLHAEQLRDIHFATAGEGDFPLIPRANHVGPWKVPRLLQYLAEPVDHLSFPEILDLDIDYFSQADHGGPFGRVFSDEYIGEIGRAVATGLECGRFGVITIALSPETTGSWRLAEELLSVLLAPMPRLYEEFAAGAPPDEPRGP